VVSASYDGTARLWDVDSGAELLAYSAHTGFVRDVAVHGGQAVTASADCTARVWDLATGRTVRTLAEHTDWLRCAAWSPDGAHVITSARDNTVRVWDIRTPAAARILRGHTDTVRTLAFGCGDGGLLVSGAVDGTARVWNYRSSDVAMCVLDGHGGAAITRVAVAPWRDICVTAGADGKVNVWGMQTGQLMRSFERHADWVSDIAITQDRQVASCSGDGTVMIWNVATGNVSATARPGRTVLCCAAVSDDETTSVVFGQQRCVMLRFACVCVRLWVWVYICIRIRGCIMVMAVLPTVVLCMYHDARAPHYILCSSFLCPAPPCDRTQRRHGSHGDALARNRASAAARQWHRPRAKRGGSNCRGCRGGRLVHEAWRMAQGALLGLSPYSAMQPLPPTHYRLLADASWPASRVGE